MLRSGWNEHSISKFNEVNARLTELMVQDDTYWRQRSKTLWLKDGGDFNMKLFHASTTTRRKAKLASMSLLLIQFNHVFRRRITDPLVAHFTKE